MIRGRRVTPWALAVAALMLGGAGCGTAPDPSPSTGVDELIIPTASPDPNDFVEVVDNPWLSLGDGMNNSEPGAGPVVLDVATTAVTTRLEGTGRLVTDLYAQDVHGNVWWFGREGVWMAGIDGAEAGLAMPATPRFGDGFAQALVAGEIVEPARVVGVGATLEAADTTYDDVLVVEVTTEVGVERRYYVLGKGLVRRETVAILP